MLPMPNGETIALPRKLMLSTKIWKEVALSVKSVSTAFKNPSKDMYVLFDRIGFFILYLFELK